MSMISFGSMAAGATGIAFAAALALNPLGDPDQAMDATVALVKESGRSYCSGVVIETHYILTNAHCVNSEYEILVLYRGHEEPVEAVVVWRGASGELDAAVMRVNEAAPYEKLGMRCDDPVRGEEIALIGHPHQRMWTTMWGKVSHQDPERESYWTVSALLNPGNSGGPAIDDKGRLLGLSTDRMTYSNQFGTTGHTGISGITSLSSVCGQLSDMGILT